MVRRGHLDVPVIGVAQGGLEPRAAARARPRQPRERTAAASTRRRSPSCSRCCATSTATTPTRRRSQALRSELGARHAPAALPRDPAEPVRRRSSQALGGVGLRARTRGSSSRSRSAATCASARELNRDAAQRLPRSRRSSASTTTSARRRCRTSSSSASPTRSSSRSGTATTSRACRSRWPRTSASRAAARFYDEVGAIRDVIQNHLLQVVGFLAMEPPVEHLRRGDPRREGEGVPRDPAARPRRPRARPVHGLPRESRASRRTRTVETFAAVRLHVDSWRWEGVPFFIRAGKSLPVTATEVLVHAQAAAAHARWRPARRTTSASGSAPRSTIALGARVKQPGEALVGPTPTELRWSTSRAATRWTPTSGCSATRWPATPMLFAREDGVEAAWAVVEPILDDADARVRVRARHLGAGRGGSPRGRHRRLARAGAACLIRISIVHEQPRAGG